MKGHIPCVFVSYQRADTLFAAHDRLNRIWAVAQRDERVRLGASGVMADREQLIHTVLQMWVGRLKNRLAT